METGRGMNKPKKILLIYLSFISLIAIIITYTTTISNSTVLSIYWFIVSASMLITKPLWYKK